MSYLIPSDYLALIQTNNLNQIITNDLRTLKTCEKSAISEATSYLMHRYDCVSEFQEVLEWSPLVSYDYNTKVYLDGLKHDPLKTTYAINDLISYNDIVYRSITGVNVTNPSTSTANWQSIGVQYQISQVKGVADTWNQYLPYIISNSVIYQNKVYVCSTANTNIIPTNTSFWTFVQNVNTNTLPNSSAWNIGDNRNAKIVEVVTDITLYNLHTRISPQNIPEIRMIRYNGNGTNSSETGAIGWLKMIKKEDITTTLKEFDPQKGIRTRMSSDVKNINSY